MIISRDRLKLYYRDRPGKGLSGYCNIPEIEKGEYGYILEAGQEVYALRYDLTNIEWYFNCKIYEITNEGLVISAPLQKVEKKFVPWEKEFPIPPPNGPITKCNLYVEPCDTLFEKNRLPDIISRNIQSCGDGEGIWYQHGGRRTVSKFEGNLKYFIKLDQMTLPDERPVQQKEFK